MRSTPFALVVALLVPLVLQAGCGEKVAPPPKPPARAKPEVWTTFYPTTWMTRRIAGDLVDVICPLPDDEDPAAWQPDAKALEGYQAADLIVVNGAGFESWVSMASLPHTRLVDTNGAFGKDDFVTFEGGSKHSHGPGPAHVHEGIDGHTWCDPLRALGQAQAIHTALARLGLSKTALDGGLAALTRDLEGLDAGFKALGRVPQGQHLYASHPAYNYPAQRYGWPVVSLDLDPESMPDDATFAQVKAKLAEKPGIWILWESEPKPAIAERFAQELGLTSVRVEPCETPLPAGAGGPAPDYLERWKANLERLKPVFAPR